MDLNRSNIKKILGIIAFAVVLFLGLQNLRLVMEGLGALYSILFPIVFGLCTAFILNVLLKLFEEREFAFLKKNTSDAPKAVMSQQKTDAPKASHTVGMFSKKFIFVSPCV